MEGEYSALDAIRDLTLTDRAFFSIVRFLDGNTRNHIVAAHLRNTSQATTVIRQFMAAQHREERRENIVMNIPLSNLSGLLDPSGNFMRNFLDPVAVVPTTDQIENATDNNIYVTDTTCAICQEAVTSATRIRHCEHCFHSHCIQEWFTMNTRCPVCRHDIRERQSLRRGNVTRDNDNRVHSDEE